MFQILFLVFIVVPIIEIAVLMQVGELIGGWPTVGIVILTAWLGAKFVRQQGLSTIQNLQLKMAQGEAPSHEIVSGLLLLVAGVFLVTPGFVTDAFGLSLLIPKLRMKIVSKVAQHMMTGAMHQANVHTHQSNQFHQQSPFDKQEDSQPIRHGQTLDGEFERKD